MKHTHTAPSRSLSRLVPALLLAGGCPATLADELPITELAPITISAHGGCAIPYDQSGVSVTLLSPEGLRKEGIINLDEALTHVPGVYVQPGGGSNQRGNASNIAIRGMSSAQFTLPMLDGLRLYDNSAGCNLTPNVLARTNMFDLGRLEVLRGSQGAIYGSGAIGGVIYMETPEGEGDPSCSLFNEFGSFSSYTGNVTAQGCQEALSYFFSATCESTRNDFQYMDGTKPADARAGRYKNWQEALRLDYRPDKDTHARITYRRSDARCHTLGTWSEPHNKYRTNLLSGSIEKRLSHAFATELTAGYFGADYTFGQGTNHDLRNVQLNWRNEYRWCRHQATTAGLACMYSRHTAEFPGHLNQNDKHEEQLFSLFAEHRITPWKNWDNTLALRWDESDVFDSLYTLRAASSYYFPEERTRLSASLSRGYQAPSSFQRMRGQYTDGYGASYQGNPALECATSWSADMGLEYEWSDNHFASMTLFWIRIEDAISTNYSTQPCTFYNADSRQTSRGIEFSLSGTWEERWNTGYSLSLTLCEPRAGQGQQIGYTARQCWAADIHTSPLEGLTTGLGVTAASGRSDWQGATPAMLDAYYTLRWYARYEVNEYLTLHLRVENLTNQKFIAESGYPYAHSLLNPGTALYGGCTITF